MTSKSYLANSLQPALAAKNVSDTQMLINYKYNCTVSIDVKGYSSKYVDKKIFFFYKACIKAQKKHLMAWAEFIAGTRKNAYNQRHITAL